MLFSSKYFTRQLLQKVCKHSVTVVASIRYPLHRRQVIWALMSQSLIFLVSIFGVKMSIQSDNINIQTLQKTWIASLHSKQAHLNWVTVGYSCFTQKTFNNEDSTAFLGNLLQGLTTLTGKKCSYCLIGICCIATWVRWLSSFKCALPRAGQHPHLDFCPQVVLKIAITSSLILSITFVRTFVNTA